MLKKSMKAMFAVSLLGLAMGAMAQRTPVRVYTALEADQVKAYKEALEKAVPDVDVQFVRDSTGVITAKLIAEKANPQADMVWGLAATSLMVLEADGLLQGYNPKGVEKLNPRFVDSKKPIEWVGMDVWAATVCFNTVEAAKRNMPKPETWKDLT